MSQMLINKDSDFTTEKTFSGSNRFLDESLSDQLFDQQVWTEPLTKFSQATGLTISLYDASLQRRTHVLTPSPIAERLKRADFWSEHGIGARIDAELAKKCLQEKRAIYSSQLDTFSHLALPIVLEGTLHGAFTLGWTPDRFADPVFCNALAKQVGIEPMEIWQLMRMQQPIAKEKIETHGRMLETFSIPLLKQLLIQSKDRMYAIRSKTISDAALAFAEAKTELQICESAFQSVRSLYQIASMAIEIRQVKEDGEQISKHNKDWFPSSDQTLTLFRATRLTIPIPSATGVPLGKFELFCNEKALSEEAIDDIRAIANQFGIALQKVLLIHALESERSALSGANAQLTHLHKMKDEFLATVSHELRSPLNAILGWSQILREEGAGAVDFELAMSTIERNAKSQAHLIEDLLDVSRIISGKMTLERDDIEATSLLKQSIETIFPMTEARRQKLHLQIPSTPIHFKGDSTRITQVFWNLLSNASKFTPEGGAITVLLENAGHYFKLEISDTGRGIPVEFLPHLFDRFSQADSSHTRRHGGLGLGLAIVRHLVELHGGTVSAHSRGEGTGSTFTVYLPQNTTDLELDSAQSITKAEGENLKKPQQVLKGVRILLVDDEPDSLRLTRFVLEKCGASIEMANNAEEGFQKLREWHPDILISDISMPGESGYELIRRVRYLSVSDGGQTPSVALTALADQKQRDLALNCGFQLHITKPLEPKALTEGILSLLSRAHGEGLTPH